MLKKSGFIDSRMQIVEVVLPEYFRSSVAEKLLIEFDNVIDLLSE